MCHSGTLWLCDLPACRAGWDRVSTAKHVGVYGKNRIAFSQHHSTEHCSHLCPRFAPWKALNAHRLLSSSCVQRFRVYAAFCYVYSLIRMKSRNHTRPWPLFFRINQLARSRTQPLWYAAKTNPETGMKTNSSNANCGAINVAVDVRTTIVTTCALLQPKKGLYNDANRICKSIGIPAFQHSTFLSLQPNNDSLRNSDHQQESQPATNCNAIRCVVLLFTWAVGSSRVDRLAAIILHPSIRPSVSEL